MNAQLYADIEKLPRNLQIEVEHFVGYLLTKFSKRQQDSLIEINQIDEQQKRSEELYQVMCDIAKEKTVFDRDNIDVMAWQKDVRTDKVLAGRES